MSNTWYYQSTQEYEVLCKPQFQALDSISHGSNLYIKSEPYCPLDSSSASGSCTTIFNSPNGHESRSPVTESCVTDDLNEFRNKLRQLESVMLSDLYEDAENGKLLVGNGIVELPDIEIWKEMVEGVPKRDLKEVLIACANAVSNNEVSTARFLISELQQMVSVAGEPIQRLGAYMLEGLVARLSCSGSSICKEPASDDLLSYTNILYEICPYFKFGYMSANGAIAEAMKDEKRIHIIDFRIVQGSQWVPLIQAFAKRPGGPPHIRITGFHDSTSKLHIVGKRLCKLAKAYNVPFEFHTEVGIESFRAQPGESLAVNFAFVLHRMPDESVSTQNHRDRVLRLVKSMNPKVVTLVEQESNTNTAPFYPRFLEALEYYHAMFESIDITLPRQHKKRINVEQHCLARDVVNIIACEGNERVERHELLGKWKLRFSMAGFSPSPMSPVVNGTIKRLLNNYSERYRVEERDGALYLGWMNRDLVASCAWK
ncbi:Transcription factor GRAS [Cynara cardunculus var. scolymus]|uniref:Transcription factor GRAS n=2 Tax=Cynara cardunculus var. scolymus TaxID=59895 RepID=A0A124SCA3_CYNCS|nr:Transcription factor GRAS [Cynara cardunculus var. scolymus]